jgi:hypothetical protein
MCFGVGLSAFCLKKRFKKKIDEELSYKACIGPTVKYFKMDLEEHIALFSCMVVFSV